MGLHALVIGLNIFIKIAKYIDIEGASCHCNRRVKYFFKNIL
jgi:hypothetical protein